MSPCCRFDGSSPILRCSVPLFLGRSRCMRRDTENESVSLSGRLYVAGRREAKKKRENKGHHIIHKYYGLKQKFAKYNNVGSPAGSLPQTEDFRTPVELAPDAENELPRFECTFHATRYQSSRFLLQAIKKSHPTTVLIYPTRT